MTKRNNLQSSPPRTHYQNIVEDGLSTDNSKGVNDINLPKLYDTGNMRSKS